MYYQYEIMKVLITSRYEKVGTLHSILFCSSAWNKGLNNRFIVSGYIKGDRRESIIETYEKWNMRQLEVYYDIDFVMDVYHKKNLKSLQRN